MARKKKKKKKPRKPYQSVDPNKRFHDLSAMIGEHYNDYLVMARGPNGETFYHQSDMNWGLGAAKSHVERMSEIPRELQRSRMKD